MSRDFNEILAPDMLTDLLGIGVTGDRIAEGVEGERAGPGFDWYRPSPHFIYFAESGEVDGCRFLKVGASNNPTRRLRELTYKSGIDLTLRVAFPCLDTDCRFRCDAARRKVCLIEETYNRAFAAYALMGINVHGQRGEWFERTAKAMTLIEGLEGVLRETFGTDEELDSKDLHTELCRYVAAERMLR